MVFAIQFHYNFRKSYFRSIALFLSFSDPTKRDLIALYNEAMDNGGFETEVRLECL